MNLSPTVEEIRARLAGNKPVSPQAPVSVTPKVLQSAVDEALRSARAEAQNRGLTPGQVRAGIDLLCQKYNFNPVERLIQLATADDCERRDEISICRFLTEFMLPKLKSVEVSGSVDHTHTVVIRRYGPNGHVSDTPAVRGTPGSGVPLARLADPIKRTIDAEVVR